MGKEGKYEDFNDRMIRMHDGMWRPRQNDIERQIQAGNEFWMFVESELKRFGQRNTEFLERINKVEVYKSIIAKEHHWADGFYNSLRMELSKPNLEEHVIIRLLNQYEEKCRDNK